MNNFLNAAVTVLVAVIGVAIIAVLVKQGNQTSSVISSATKGFASILGVAENPGGSSSGLGGTFSNTGNPFAGGGIVQAS
jgi:hypothetical protein